MSVSIVTSPGAIVSAFRPVIFKVSSTVEAPELQIRGEVSTKNNSGDPFMLAGIKYERKYLGNAYFIFDLSNILRAKLGVDRITATQSAGVITSHPGSVVSYKIKFTEVYYDPSTGLPADYGTLWSGVFQAVNSIPQHEEDQSLTDYILVGEPPDNPFGTEFNESF